MSWFIGSEERSRLFILDDISPLGIELPDEMLSLLKQYNKTKILDSESLAEDLYLLAEGDDPVTVLGNGGALTYVLLSRIGYRPDYSFVGMKRSYGKRRSGKTDIKYDITPNGKAWDRILDDVVAGGGTVNFAIRELGLNKPEMLLLVLSGEKRGEFRCKEGSTISNVDRVVSPVSVRYNRGFPAIFSARYLLKKVPDDRGSRRYLSKYIGGRVDEFVGIAEGVDIEPLDMLYRDPDLFIKEFG